MARFLGIDIGDHAIRGALVRTALRKVELERYVEIPLTVSPGDPARGPELEQAGRNLLSALPAPPDSVVASAPGDVISLRTVELPSSVRKRIDDVLPFELEASLPYDTDDAVIDHQPIATEGDQMKLLVASMMKDHVRSTLEDLRQAGIEPRELAAGSAALDGLVNLMPELKTSEPILLLDMADHHTDLCFLLDGRCVFGRTVAVGIEDLPGSASELERGLRRTLTAYRVEGFAAPSAVYLCGSGAAASGTREWLADRLGESISLLQLPQPLEGAASAVFGRAAALAGRGVLGGHHINLRTGEFAAADTGGRLVEHVNLITTCAVAVVMSIMFSLKAQQSVLIDEQADLRDQLGKTTKAVLGRTVEDPELVAKQISNPKSSDPLPQFDAFDTLAAVSSLVAEGVEHEVRRLRIDVAQDKKEGRMELQGSLTTLEERDSMVEALEGHPCFHDIERGKTTPARGKERINYQIEATLRCPGDGIAKKKGKGKD